MEDPNTPATKQTDVYAATLVALQVIECFEISYQIYEQTHDLKFGSQFRETIKSLPQYIKKDRIPLPPKIAQIIKAGMNMFPNKRPSAQTMSENFSDTKIQEAISSFLPNFTPMSLIDKVQ